MAQVIAVTEIVRNVKPGRAADKDKGIKAEKPVSRSIMPGTLFVSEGEELAFLRKARAVRDPEPLDLEARRRAIAIDEDEPVAKPAKSAKSAKAKAAADADDNGDSGNDLV